MHKTQFVTWSLVLVVGMIVVGAQQPQDRSGAQQPQDRSAQQSEGSQVEGELFEVDPAAMTFSVRTSDGTEEEFAYTAQTEVTGAQEGVAGLATMTGQQVTVHYEEQSAQQQQPQAGQPKNATRIEIRSDAEWQQEQRQDPGQPRQPGQPDRDDNR